MIKRKNINIIFFLILPIILYLLTFYMLRVWYGNDPEYAYLLNSLNINYFERIGHTDHPGTPLQVIGAVILRIYHIFDFSNKNDLRTSVLSNPEFYVMLIINVLQFINVLFVFLVGYISYKLTKNIWISFISQFFPFLSVIIIEIICTKLTPEVLLILNNSMLMILLFYYSSCDDNQRNKYTLYFSLIIGLGIAIKVTSIPLIIIPLILIKGFNRKSLFVLYTILSFVFFTIPIMNQYHSFFKWISGLFNHSGIYGQGTSEIINIVKFQKELFYLIESNFLMFIIIGLSILFVVVIGFLKKIRNIIIHDINFKILISLIVSEIIGFLMVAKHPGYHYLTPFLCLGSINIVSILLILNKLFIKTNKWLNPLVILIMVTVFLFSIVPQIKLRHDVYQLARNEYYNAKKIIQSHNNSLKICFIPYAYNQFSALDFGDVYSCGRNRNALKSLYPSVIFYDSRFNSFYNWDGVKSTVNIYEIAKNNNLIFLSSPLEDSVKKNIQSYGLVLNNIYSAKTQEVYELNINKEDSIYKIIQMKKYYNALVEINMKKIKENKKLLASINEKSVKSGIPIDSLIFSDAKKLADSCKGNYYNALIEEKIQAIKQSTEWLNSIKEKSKNKNISLDSMLYLDAKWMIDLYGK